MGMYTELIFGAEIREDIDEKTLNVLKYLFEGGLDPPTELPDHPFFNCDRWGLITRCSSYYFAVSHPHRSIRLDSGNWNWICSLRANLKNYDNEIEKFLDWIKPYIERGSGARNFYAIVCYEEQEEPTIYYLEDKKI